jgi:hypothetical protein
MWHQAYGVQCTRLNYEADAAVPLYTTPYEQVEFADVANDIFADGDDDDIYRHLDGFCTCISGIEYASPASVLHPGIMERMQASDRQSIMNLQYDVEHKRVVELLGILEDGQCLNYMLQKVLQWACTAKFDGFDFNPKATTRRTNITWMYQYLERAHQRLPHVISTTLMTSRM